MQEKEFFDKLQQYPELKERFKQLLAIVENAEGDTTLANEAERRVIEELRMLGKDALQNWANRQTDKVIGQVKKQKPGMRKHTKKNSSGIVATEK